MANACTHDAQHLHCLAGRLIRRPPAPRLTCPQTVIDSSYQVTVAIETDVLFRQKFGSDDDAFVYLGMPWRGGPMHARAACTDQGAWCAESPPEACAGAHERACVLVNERRQGAGPGGRRLLPRDRRRHRAGCALKHSSMLR